MKGILKVAILWSLVGHLVAFLPSMENGNSDHTHASITRAAIYLATADVINYVIDLKKYNSSDVVETVNGYFNGDCRLVRFLQTVEDIINKIAQTQRYHHGDTERTMSCNQIEAGHLLLQSLRNEIIYQAKTANPNWDAMRDLIGQYLFTLQEFYSNTNWVDMFGNQICQELGISNKSLRLNVPSEMVPRTPGKNGIKSELMKLASNECYLDPRNKQRVRPEVSRDHLHQQSAEAATGASVGFLIGEGTGLLHILGLDKFKELLGMTYKKPCYNCLAQGLSVIVVLDGTGSVSGEIRAATRNSIDANHLESNIKDRTVLESLSDTIVMKLSRDKSSKSGQVPSILTTNDLINALKEAQTGSCLLVLSSSDAEVSILTKKEKEFTDLITRKKIAVVVFKIARQTPKIYTKRRRRGLGGLDFFDKIASATGGLIVHTTSTSLGSILGSFVTNNMGVAELEVDSFTISSRTEHTWSVDRDLSLLTVRLNGVSSPSMFTLDRPDGITQIFSGSSSVDVVGSTTVLSIQKPPVGKWTLHKKEIRTWKVKVGGSGNIDFTYKFMEDVHGIKYPITGTSPITGSTVLLSVTVTGLPAAARVLHIVLKTPDGAILKVLPVKDNYSDASRVLYAEYNVTSEKFMVSINGSLDSKTFTREKSEVVTPVTGSIEFSSKPEKLVLGKTSVIEVNVTNTGSTSRVFQVNTTSAPAGFVTESSRLVTVTAHAFQIVNIPVTAKSLTLAYLTVKLNLGGTTLQTIKRTLQVADLAPPEMNTVNKTDKCEKTSMNYFNCSLQKWTIVMDIKFHVNMSRLYATPRDLAFNFTLSSTSPDIYTAILSGTCCVYRSTVSAIDTRGNMKSWPVDFSGGQPFNTTVDNFDRLVKSVDKEKISPVSDKSFLYGVIGGGIGGLTVVAAIVAVLVYFNRARGKAPEVDGIDSLSTMCFEASFKYSDRNSRPSFVRRAR